MYWLDSFTQLKVIQVHLRKVWGKSEETKTKTTPIKIFLYFIEPPIQQHRSNSSIYSDTI